MQQTAQQTKSQGEWVILEAMGHNRVAGYYYFENGLHRVDIPDVNQPGQFIRTERYGPASIFRITSVDQETALLVAVHAIIPEAIPWEARRQLRELAAPPRETIEQLALEYRDDDDDDDDPDEDDFKNGPTF